MWVFPVYMFDCMVNVCMYGHVVYACVGVGMIVCASVYWILCVGFYMCGHDCE